MNNISSMINHSVFRSLTFLLLCCECGYTDEPAASTEPAIDSKNKAIEAIKALRGHIARDDTSNVIRVDFSNITISDAGLVHLQELTRLTFLNLVSTKVSDGGVMKLKAAIPDCRIALRNIVK